MRVAGKTRPTKGAKKSTVLVDASTGRRWAVSAKTYKKVIEILDREQAKVLPFDRGEDLTLADEVFAKDFEAAGGKAALLLRASREKARMTQKQLAEKLGVHQPDIANMEKGRRSISKVIAKKLAEIFETDYRIFL